MGMIKRYIDDTVKTLAYEILDHSKEGPTQSKMDQLCERLWDMMNSNPKKVIRLNDNFKNRNGYSALSENQLEFLRT